MYQPKLLLMLSSSLILISLLILLRDFNRLSIMNLNSGNPRLFSLIELQLSQPRANTKSHSEKWL